jgi:hypothetical protein
MIMKRKETIKSVKVMLFILLGVILLECTLFNLKYWTTAGLTPRLDASELEVTMNNGVVYADTVYYLIAEDAEITI